MTPLTDAMLAELERLAKAATAGPWRLDEDFERGVSAADTPIAKVYGSPLIQAAHNAAFIAAANPQAVLALLAALAAAREALRPFVEQFEHQREAYLRRGERSIMEGNFDRMPDHWPVQKMLITMGECRAARAALPQARAESGKGDA